MRGKGLIVGVFRIRKRRGARRADFFRKGTTVSAPAAHAFSQRLAGEAATRPVATKWRRYNIQWRADRPSLATQRLHDRRGESCGMAWMRRSYEVAIDDDRRVLHPGCTSGFGVGLHDQLGIGRAVVESRHVAPGNDLRAGRQHRPSADASDNAASSADVLDELGDARIFGQQGRAFCTPWNEDADIVLGPGFGYRALDIQQSGSREIAVDLDGRLARGHHLDFIAGLIEGDLRKEVLLLLKRVSDQSGNLGGSVGHCVASCDYVSMRTVIPCTLEWNGLDV